MDKDGYCKILGDGTAEIKGKGRFYVFKKDAQSALAKKEEYLWKPNVEVSFDINVDSILHQTNDSLTWVDAQTISQMLTKIATVATTQ